MTLDKLLVIGSQALHGSISTKLPKEAERSVEVEVLSERLDKVDGLEDAVRALVAVRINL